MVLTAETAFDDTFNTFRRSRKKSEDAYYGTGEGDPNDLAQDALDEIEKTKKKLQDGIDAWEQGDEGGIGPSTAESFNRFISHYESLATQVRERTQTTEQDPGDVPLDTPPPQIYREEIDPPWIKVTEGSFAPTQGVWQDEDKEVFDDKPGKQLTQIDPKSWTAELKMVANRSTLLFGIREDRRNRIKMAGTTTYSRLAKVKFQFKLIQKGGEKIIWTEPKANNTILLDGPAGPEEPWAASLMASEGLPPRKSFIMEPGNYRIEAELLRENDEPTGLKVAVDGEAVQTRFANIKFVPVILSGPPPAQEMLELARRAKRLALETEMDLPRIFPLPRDSVTAVQQPLQDLRSLEPGFLRTLWSKLPGTPTLPKESSEIAWPPP